MRRGGRVDRQLEPRGKLQRAEHTQRVVAKRCRIDHAQDTALEIVPALKRIEILVR